MMSTVITLTDGKRERYVQGSIEDIRAALRSPDADGFVVFHEVISGSGTYKIFVRPECVASIGSGKPNHLE